MSIKNWGLWRAGVFKNIRFLFTAAQRTQEALLISEASTISLEHMPMAMGFFSMVERHMSWLVVHKLKSRIKETGHAVMEITERSYISPDIYHVFTEEDKADIQQLPQVAHTRYIEKKNSITSDPKVSSNIRRNIIYICLFIIVLVVVFSIKK